MTLLLIVLAILCFLLAVFGATPADLDAVRLTALGLVFFAAAHLPIDTYLHRS
jgi:hypothetical protein